MIILPPGNSVKNRNANYSNIFYTLTLYFITILYVTVLVGSVEKFLFVVICGCFWS